IRPLGPAAAAGSTRIDGNGPGQDEKPNSDTHAHGVNGFAPGDEALETARSEIQQKNQETGAPFERDDGTASSRENGATEIPKTLFGPLQPRPADVVVEKNHPSTPERLLPSTQLHPFREALENLKTVHAAELESQK